MNTCSYCGKPVQMGMARCQFCGKPLTGEVSRQSGGGGSTNATTPGQPALPAWLETLRAGDQSNTSSTSVSGASGLSPDDFADENQLPGWMQADRNDAVDNNPSGAYPVVQRPASMSAPNTDNAFIPTRGMSASSFIDEQFLPTWLQEKRVATPTTPQENIAASSLVQQDALPDWIKAVPPQSPSQTPPVAQPVTLYGQQANSVNPSTPVRPPEGIAGNDLIDQQAVPPWMAGQHAAVPTDGQTGFAASSLIDKDVLPPWIREGNQEPSRGNAHVFNPPQIAQPTYGQPANYSPPLGQVQGQLQAQPRPFPVQQEGMHDQMQAPQLQQPPNVQQTSLANQNFSASSFIDVNALPDWLRAPGDAQPGVPPSTSPTLQGGADSQRQGTFGIPPRPEYVRVPSRPRGESGSNEESAVAANAFASMLGVASATPFFPGQQSRDAQQGQGQQGQSQNQLPMPIQSPQNMPVAPVGNEMGVSGMAGSNMSSATWGAPASQGGQGFAPVPPAPGYPNGYDMNSMPGRLGTVPPQSAQLPQSLPTNGARMQQGMPMNSNEGQSKTQGKSAKRGFLSTILDWFSR